MNILSNPETLKKNITPFEWFITILVIVVPIIFCPFCITVFVPAKEITYILLVFIGLAGWAVQIIWQKPPYLKRSALNRPILLFVLLAILSLWWSTNTAISWKALPLFLAGPVLFFLVINNINREVQIIRIIRLIIIINLIFGIYGLLQYNGMDFNFWTGNTGRSQVFGLFGNVNYFAEYLLPGFILGIVLLLSRLKMINSYLLGLHFLIVGSALLITFMRSAYLAILITLLGLVYLLHKKRLFPKLKSWQKWVIFVLILFIFSSMLSITFTQIGQDIPLVAQLRARVSWEQLTQSPSILRRAATYKFSWMMIQDYWLIGSGIGTYPYHTLKYQAQFFSRANNREIYPHGFATKTHNEYFQLWAELGLIGLLLFLLIMIIYFKKGLQAINRANEHQKIILIAGLSAIFAILIDALFNFPFHLPASVMLFWLIMGLSVVEMRLIALSQSEEPHPDIKALTWSRFFKEKGKWALTIIIIILMVFLALMISRPFIARIYWYYGDQQLKKGNDQQAFTIYQKGIKWDPYQGELYYDMAELLMNNNLNHLAVEYLEKTQQYADFPGLPQNIATAYYKDGQLDKALRYYRKAITYQSYKHKMVPLYTQMGYIYIRQKEFKKAKQALNSTLTIKSKHAPALYQMAMIALTNEGIQAAITQFQKVIDLAPKSREATLAGQMIEKLQLMQPDQKIRLK